MDALRWTLLIVAILVIGGIYAWGRREQILAWWHGQRDDDSYRVEEEGDDVSDELQRLRDLMESEKDDRPPRRTHTDRDAEQFDYDLGVEVSAPRPVQRAEAAGERDVLLEAAAAKAAKSKPVPPVSQPRVVTGENRVKPRTAKIEIGAPSARFATRPVTDTGPADFATGADSVSKPRVRPRPVEAQSAPAITPAITEALEAVVPSPSAPPTSNIPPSKDEPSDPVEVGQDVPMPMNAGPLTGSREIDGHVVETTASARDAVEVLPSAPVHEVPEPQRQAEPPQREPAQAEPVPQDVVVQKPLQSRLDLEEVEPTPPPQARQVRRLDTVIVDGEIFDTKGRKLPKAEPVVSSDTGLESDEPRTPSPGLTELAERVTGRVTGWFKGVGVAARERLPKRQEPPVQSTPELILVLHVMAPKGSHFNGDEVRDALLAQKLSLGDNGLYQVLPKHRATTAPVVCVANMLEPGVLTDDELDGLQTPGLSLFLRLPGPVEGVEALETLLTTAQAISRQLDGEMRDQARNRLTRQSITHMHEQVLEHARRMQIALSRKR
ncbi:MAG: hypothetical protein H6981_09050 [Gammaproteobacteria bacterium]|nr:hypothetical protein [Gammaproteobacteria bacterium]MCP5136936.1 hypothetical protein [Gammaproteobacteria bacterium]